jgi:hypothetical protein
MEKSWMWLFPAIFQGKGLWCATPLSTICQFYWLRKPEYLEKTTNLSQVTDKLYRIFKNALLKDLKKFFYLFGIYESTLKR